jgi:hypothetical protein
MNLYIAESSVVHKTSGSIMKSWRIYREILATPKIDNFFLPRFSTFATKEVEERKQMDTEQQDKSLSAK